MPKIKDYASQMMWLGKVLLKYVIAFLLLFFLLRWVDFSVAQSVTLALLLLIGYDLYKTVSAEAKAGETFTPYQLVVWPKFEELLLDYKLLKDTGEAEALHALWEKKDQRLISFTVLQLRPRGDWLIYSNTDNYFRTDMDLEEPIEALAFSSYRNRGNGEEIYLRDPSLPEDGVRNRCDSPSFYFRQRGGFYELGLKVRDDWWKKVCAANPTEEVSKTTVRTDYMIGEADLTIAKIPQTAFAIFHVGQADTKQIENIWKVMDSELDLHGWKREQDDPNAEVWDPWIRIKHKYFRVQYREI
jgi:hypothetical protein